MRYVVSGQITQTIEASGETIAEAVERWRLMAGRGYPDDWEDVSDEPDEAAHGAIVGPCEACAQPILEGEEYSVDLEDVIYTCHRCLEKWAQEAERG